MGDIMRHVTVYGSLFPLYPVHVNVFLIRSKAVEQAAVLPPGIN
jgi:hypothetical protein